MTTDDQDERVARKYTTDVYIPYGGYAEVHHGMDTYRLTTQAFALRGPFIGMAVPIAVTQMNENMSRVSTSGWVLRGVTQESDGYLEWEDRGDIMLRVVVTG